MKYNIVFTVWVYLNPQKLRIMLSLKGSYNPTRLQLMQLLSRALMRLSQIGLSNWTA